MAESRFWVSMPRLVLHATSGSSCHGSESPVSSSLPLQTSFACFNLACDLRRDPTSPASPDVPLQLADEPAKASRRTCKSVRTYLYPRLIRKRIHFAIRDFSVPVKQKLASLTPFDYFQPHIPSRMGSEPPERVLNRPIGFSIAHGPLMVAHGSLLARSGPAPSYL